MAEEYSDADIQGYIQQKEGEINSALNQGNPKNAVIAACTDPPTLWTKNQDLKAKFATTVIGALCQLKENQYAATIDAMNEDQQDILMKFVYKGLALGQHSQLFKLHAALYAKTGHGSIVRALTERRSV
eukprot:CAMPEP_0168597712 /NCGR_PEP_ID=MMETSP0420-20121227/10860_1 /TAXON_ID=498008 /ORGANISM="Pessonella sp." /LENGTH=128 /DNA_ID=CAMNT_0008634681 /DNA_START=13 /DNA_END=399 /DNA_ORIENTATION=-